MSFCWLKLGLGLLNVVIDAVLLAILMGIGFLFNNGTVYIILFMVWLGGIKMVNFVMNHYLGYMAKAGHLAVIAESYRTGEIPDAPIAVGKKMVLERFGTANVYFAIDKLVAGAVRQVQRMLGRLTGPLLNMIPGGENIQKLINYFLELSLGYIDECCLCYTFCKPERNPYRSAADGVVLYAQNWKSVLKNAAGTMLMVFISVAVITLVVFVAVGLVFRMMEWNGLIAFVLSLMVACVIKYAFIDSWIMVRMIQGYMSEAQAAPPAIDLYEKLSGWSAKFRELFQKGQEEEFSSEATEPTTESAPAVLPGESTVAVPSAPEKSAEDLL